MSQPKKPRKRQSQPPPDRSYERFLLERICWHVSGSQLEFSDFREQLRKLRLIEPRPVV